MASWLPAAAAKCPEQVAIESTDNTVTYAELHGQAAAAARDLGNSIAPVILETADRLKFARAVHACLLAERPFVPIDPRLGEEERALRRRTAVRTPGTLCVLHTSGTTAAPKTIELTYENFLASALGSAVALGLDQQERWLAAMPLTHVGGLSILIRSVIYATTVVLHERFDTEAVLRELMDPERRITLVSLVPTMLARLLDAGLAQPPTLRWALIGGGPIPPALLQRAERAGVPVASTYGMTEACSQLFTFGVPLPGVQYRLLEGEIVVRGPMVAPGALGADGWLHTGDVGHLDEHGRLEIAGRKSDTIITGGENVHPQEIEDVLRAHPVVADAAVVGRPDPEWGEAVAALVVLRDGTALDADELREHCRSRLAAFKVPKTVEAVSSLPRTTSGKLVRWQIG